MIWVVRHSHIGDAFFDLDAADYLLDELKSSEGTPGFLVRCLCANMQAFFCFILLKRNTHSSNIGLTADASG